MPAEALTFVRQLVADKYGDDVPPVAREEVERARDDAVTYRAPVGFGFAAWDRGAVLIFLNRLLEFPERVTTFGALSLMRLVMLSNKRWLDDSGQPIRYAAERAGVLNLLERVIVNKATTMTSDPDVILFDGDEELNGG